MTVNLVIKSVVGGTVRCPRCMFLPAVSSQSPRLTVMSSKATEPQSQKLLQVLTKTTWTAKANSEQRRLRQLRHPRGICTFLQPIIIYRSARDRKTKTTNTLLWLFSQLWYLCETMKRLVREKQNHQSNAECFQMDQYAKWGTKGQCEEMLQALRHPDDLIPILQNTWWW